MRKVAWLSCLGLGLALAGCGGGSGSLIGGTTPLAPDFSRDAGVTARIEVDPATNTAKVTNLGPEGRAIWQGNSVKVESAEVFQLPGSSVSSRVLRLKFKNTTRIPLGLNEPLTASLSTAASDFSAMTEAGIGTNSLTDGAVASASLGTPRAVWEDTDGTMYVAQGASNGIRRIRNGTVSTIGSGYQNVFGITGDPQGDWIYFIERDRHRIIKLRKDGSEGAVLAGGPGAGDGIGTGASILFNTPTGLSYGDGNLYVADLGNGKVKKLTNINATPVATLAATVPNATGVDYGIIQGRPILGVTSGSTGQVYVVDPLTARTASIRTLSTGIFGIAVNEGRLVITNPSTDQITVLRVPNGSNPYVLASWAQEYVSPSVAGFIDGLNPRFSDPLLASKGNGNSFLVADSLNHRVRRLILPNFVSGSSTQPVSFTNEEWTTPSGRAMYTIGQLNPNQEMTVDVGFTVQFEAGMTFYVTVAGGGVAPIAIDAGTNDLAENVYTRLLAGGERDFFEDGIGRSAGFSAVGPIHAFDNGNIVIGSGRKIRRYRPNGQVDTVGNVFNNQAVTEGNGETLALPNNVAGLSASADGTKLFFSSGNTLWFATGAFSSPGDAAPNSFFYYRIGGAADNASGLSNGTGDTVRFNLPFGIYFDEPAKKLYIADTNNNRIVVGYCGTGNYSNRSDWSFLTFAGTGTSGFADAHFDLAQFSNPFDIEKGGDDKFYVTDVNNKRLRRLDPVTSQVTTVAGDGTNNSTDGQPGQITFPRFLASDDAGTIYFTDNGALRAFRNGRIYTVNINVGGGLTDGFTDGNGQQAADYITVNKKTGTVYTLTGTPVTRLLSFEAVVP
ncbi:MAG TPA: hypothetical protein DCY02_00085 [Armatimonadetes bacterium]|nr:hypothetical protein [Armatimonadota bacterium]HCM74061.1 hypothetical protein [Armatimonadota bacterium]